MTTYRFQVNGEDVAVEVPGMRRLLAAPRRAAAPATAVRVR